MSSLWSRARSHCREGDSHGVSLPTIMVCTCSIELEPNQRDDMQVDQTGLHHLVGWAELPTCIIEPSPRPSGLPAACFFSAPASSFSSRTVYRPCGSGTLRRHHRTAASQSTKGTALAQGSLPFVAARSGSQRRRPSTRNGKRLSVGAPRNSNSARQLIQNTRGRQVDLELGRGRGRDGRDKEERRGRGETLHRGGWREDRRSRHRATREVAGDEEAAAETDRREQERGRSR